MKPPRNLTSILAVLVLAQFGGCASYQPGSFPKTDPKPEPQEESVEIRVGSEVQVEMTNGDRFSGEVMRFSETELVLGRSGNYGFEEWTMARADMAHIEVRKESGAATVAAAAVGVLCIAFVALGVLVVATGGVNMGG